jgi:hypothetical protein
MARARIARLALLVAALALPSLAAPAAARPPAAAPPRPLALRPGAGAPTPLAPQLPSHHPAPGLGRRALLKATNPSRRRDWDRAWASSRVGAAGGGREARRSAFWAPSPTPATQAPACAGRPQKCVLTAAAPYLPSSSLARRPQSVGRAGLVEPDGPAAAQAATSSVMCSGKAAGRLPATCKG